MFFGTYRHLIDEKNRFRVPTKLKEDLGTNWVITKGANGCLCGFSKQTMEQDIYPKLNGISMFDAEAQKPLRILFSSAFETEEDKQGRILLPQELKAYAGITKNMVTIGVGSRIEIWAEEAFDAYTKDTNFATESAKLSEYGI